MATRRDSEHSPQSWILMFLGAEVKARREAAGMSQQELGRLTLTSRPLLAAIEAGTRIPRQSFIDRAEVVLNAGGGLERLFARLMDAQHEPWFNEYLALERDATEIRVFAAQVIPGLLQTVEYTRALWETHQPPKGSEYIEGQVEARMVRQQLLTRTEPRPPRAWFVIDEAAFHRWPAVPGVAKGQLLKLLEVGSLPYVTILIVPFGQGIHAGRDGSQTVLSFADGSDIGYVEPVGGGLVVTDSMRVEDMRSRYDLLLSEALSAEESAKLIRQFLETS